MTPYSGTEKYIFISYAHKDSGRVLPLVEGLAQAGFRVWYDEGIEAGSEWPAFISARLRACHRMIYFVTEAAVESRNCRNEVNLAFQLHKEILVTYLDHVELKHGMDLQLGTSQSIFRDKYADDAAFLRALTSAEILKDCCEKITVSAPNPTPAPTSALATPQAPRNAVYAKRGQPGLTDVIIPDGVTEIEDGAFKACKSLRSVVIHDSVTSIGNEAFYDCSELTSVTIPDSVKSIGTHAFGCCSELKSVYIPDSVTNIDLNPFTCCTSIVKIEVATSNPKYHSSGNCLIETKTKVLISGCQSSIIPYGVTSIGGGAFFGCSGLTSVYIPDSVTRIESFAFSDCSEITCVIIPDSVTDISVGTFNNCSGLTSVTIADSVKSIEDLAFRGCSGLTSVTIPDSITNIGYATFWECSGLTSVTIPNCVTSIGEYAFSACQKLTTIHFSGTKKQWRAIKKYQKWNENTGKYKVYCTDGVISKLFS